MIPASGKVFAENEKVRLCVVKELEIIWELRNHPHCI